MEDLDQEEWVGRISPVGLYFVNEYGNGTAIFDNLVRGEFHFLEREISASSYARYAACTAWTGTSCAARTARPGSGGGR